MLTSSIFSLKLLGEKEDGKVKLDSGLSFTAEETNLRNEDSYILIYVPKR